MRLHLWGFTLTLLAFTSHVAAENGTLVVQATRLIGFNGCSKEQQRQIYDAWDDAVKFGSFITGKIKWSGLEEDAFLGPSFLNDEWQNDIKKVVENAGTFGRAWFFNPFSWQIHMRCGDWLKDPTDKSKSCKTSLNAAYTNNPGQANKNPTINFCPKFFTELNTCKNRVDRFRNSPKKDYKYNLQNYQCQGAVMLHEMFHIDLESQVGKQGHITDLKIRYYDEHYEANGEVDAYGPFWTKVLARYWSEDLGKFIVTNADDLAQYVLAKWVTSKIGKFTELPTPEHRPNADPIDRKYRFITFSNGTLTITNETAWNASVESPLSLNEEDLAQICDDCESNAITITRFSNSSQALQQLDNELAGLEPAYDHSPLEPYVLPDNPYLKCLKSEIYPEGQPFVSADDAYSAIENFCSQNVGENLTPAPVGARFNTYPVPSSGKKVIWLGAEINFGDSQCQGTSKIDRSNCISQFKITINDCDTSSKNKYGGVIVNECVAWSFDVNNDGENPFPPENDTSPSTKSSKSTVKGSNPSKITLATKKTSMTHLEPEPSATVVAISQISDGQPQAPTSSKRLPDPKPTPKPKPKPKLKCTDGLSNVDQSICLEGCHGGDCVVWTNPFLNSPPWYVCNC